MKEEEWAREGRDEEGEGEEGGEEEEEEKIKQLALFQTDWSVA